MSVFEDEQLRAEHADWPADSVLQNLRQHDDQSISCQITPRHRSANELGVISAAEAARHLAVLGSYAVAQHQVKPRRHYYLAQRGEIQCFNYMVQEQAPLNVVAQGQLIKRGKAIAHTELQSLSGETLYSCDVAYQVMSKRAFHRIFPQWQQPVASMNPDPGLHEPFEFQYLDILAGHSHRMRGKIHSLTDPQCLGNLKGCSCLPNTCLLSAMSSAAGSFLNRLLKQPTCYVVRDAVFGADQLVFAGEAMTIDIDYLGHYRRNCHSFKCRAYNDDKQFGELYLNLMAVPMSRKRQSDNLTDESLTI